MVLCYRMELLVRGMLLLLLLYSVTKYETPLTFAVVYTVGSNVVPLVVYGLHHVTTMHALLIDVARFGACGLYYWLLARREGTDLIFWIIFVAGFAVALI